MRCPKYNCEFTNPDQCLLRQKPSRLWDGSVDPICKTCKGFTAMLNLRTELTGLRVQAELFHNQIALALAAIEGYEDFVND